MASIAGKVGAVFIQTLDTSVTFTAEATTGDVGHLRYTITAGAKRYWDPSAAVTVRVDGSTVTTGFTIEYAGGVIVFDASQGASVITVSGKFFYVAQVGGFFNWSIDLAVDTAEATAFGDGWKAYVPTIKGFNGTAEMYWGDERFFTMLGRTVIFAFYADATTSLARYEGFGVISGDGVEVNVDDLVKESIDFQGTGQLYYRP